MNAAEEFFLVEAVRHARTLPFPQMMEFLRGMSFAIDANPEYKQFGIAYANLTACDHQLELIASGQLRLDLGDREAITKKRGRK